MKTFVIVVSILYTCVVVAGNRKGDGPGKNLIVLTDETFRKEIKKGIVVVDFWAVWCGPCKRQSPVIEELAFEERNRAKFGKLDIDKNPEVSNLYQVSSIPTIIIYKDGKPAKTFVGLTPKQDIVKALDSITQQE
jgi:thioredoxin 1